MYLRDKAYIGSSSIIQGPVNFHDVAIISGNPVIVYGDLTVVDTLASYGGTLQINGSLMNNGVIGYDLTARVIGDITNHGIMNYSYYYLVNNGQRTTNIVGLCNNNFIQLEILFFSLMKI